MQRDNYALSLCIGTIRTLPLPHSSKVVTGCLPTTPHFTNPGDVEGRVNPPVRGIDPGPFRMKYGDHTNSATLADNNRIYGEVEIYG
jgi:hypothetical protein